jgi:outer membrane PBP1 activator LpoA protein
VGTIETRSRARLWALLMGSVLALAAPFSAAQTPPASSAPAVAAPQASPDKSTTPQASDKSDAPQAPDKSAAPEAPERPTGDVEVAIVLPLGSTQYARAADAVRTGFLAAAEASGTRVKVRAFAHGDDDVLLAFEAARASGAKIIVGPLVRDDVRTVAGMSLEMPTTLALNQLDDAAAAPPNMYTLALGVDGDARLIARRMRTDAAQNVAVVNADTPLMRRMVGAFGAEWSAGGGSAPSMYGYVATPDGLAAMRRELLKKPPDAALLAVDGASATQAKPYLGTTRTYASGLVFDRATAAVMRDLDGLVVVEIPWLVTPQAPQFANLPRKEFPSDALTRLYALGLDAWRAAMALRDNPSERSTFEGATGQVTLLEGHQFQREGVFAVLRAGQLAPLDGAR